jgi:hypothetical protein
MMHRKQKDETLAAQRGAMIERTKIDEVRDTIIVKEIGVFTGGRTKGTTTSIILTMEYDGVRVIKFLDSPKEVSDLIELLIAARADIWPRS